MIPVTMPIKITTKTPGSPLTKTDLLIIFGKEGSKVKLPESVRIPDNALESFAGKEREVRITDALKGEAKRVLLLGLGKGSDISGELLRRTAAMAVKKAEQIGSRSAAVWVDLSFGHRAAGFGQALAEGMVLGSYRLSEFKSKAQPAALKRISVYGDRAFNTGVRRGDAIGTANILARRLQDTPANRMRPRDLVREARKLAGATARISIRVHDEKAMARLKMGSLLSVSRGSAEPAYLIHLVYKPSKKARGKICLVGKGLTFDSGGISIKPSAKMHEMKYDMSGGAAVLGVFQALATLRPDVEVHGLVPTSENLPDGLANKPGDVVKACNGLTIEVLNTDAEGRLILADALAYAAKKIKPDAMIDLATLTGAVVVALGHELSGVMGNSRALLDELVASGEATGEQVWPLPILQYHKQDMKGSVGDLRNISSPETGAGSCTAGAFLSYFVGDIPWAHIDIAGSAWGAGDRDYQGGSVGTGVGVRLLVDYLENCQGG
jgi:leucyl aminopeptidase